MVVVSLSGVTSERKVENSVWLDLVRGMGFFVLVKCWNHKARNKFTGDKADRGKTDSNN